MYRKTRKYQQHCATMRAAKERRRLEAEPVERPGALPDLRRRITIEDFDSGQRVAHVMELYRTGRVDCYRAVADGKLWRHRIGWSKVIEAMRKSFPRVSAP